MVVVGAGVSGLSTAIRLQERGVEVAIVTADAPAATTSAVAAAIWYPYRAYPQDRVLAWGLRTFAQFQALAGEPESGVRMAEVVELFREPTGEPWWKQAVPHLRHVAADERSRAYADGLAFAAPLIEMPIYLDYLLRRFQAAGGTVQTRRLAALKEIGDKATAIVNCSGLGSRELAADAEVTPIRGQVVRVANPGLDRVLLDEDDPAGPTYVVPRSSDCILGGTAEEGEWSLEPDPSTAASILRRCTNLEPRLGDAPLLEHRVGLRPGRPAVRLEAEVLSTGTTCVHNYGHGGAGVTLSWGCAEEATELVLRALDQLA